LDLTLLRQRFHCVRNKSARSVWTSTGFLSSGVAELRIATSSAAAEKKRRFRNRQISPMINASIRPAQRDSASRASVTPECDAWTIAARTDYAKTKSKRLPAGLVLEKI